MIKKISYLALTVFILNLIWEFSHHYFYIDLTKIPHNLHLFLASFADVIIILFLFMVISINLKKRSFYFDWINNPRKKDYTKFIIISIFFAFIWEIINLSLGRWQYTSKMPLIFGVGLSPLLQLAITGSLGLFINSFFKITPSVFTKSS